MYFLVNGQKHAQILSAGRECSGTSINKILKDSVWNGSHHALHDTTPAYEVGVRWLYVDNFQAGSRYPISSKTCSDCAAYQLQGWRCDASCSQHSNERFRQENYYDFRRLSGLSNNCYSLCCSVIGLIKKYRRYIPNCRQASEWRIRDSASLEA